MTETEDKKLKYDTDQKKPASEMNLQNIIVVGQCKGTYHNESVTKEFKAKVLVTARPDGTVIVHNLEGGIRPLCYIDGGADISMARNLADCDLQFLATTEDGQQLELLFTELIAMQGIPTGEQTNSVAMKVLKCVFDLGGNYGRTTIARVLTGSVSKKILTINISKLGTYATCAESSMKELLSLIDWLIQENYLAYVEDAEFPVLVVTSRGLDVLAGEGMVDIAKEEATRKEQEEQKLQKEIDKETQEIERKKKVLAEYREERAKKLNKPKASPRF
jgi:hypothetical protein